MPIDILLHGLNMGILSINTVTRVTNVKTGKSIIDYIYTIGMLSVGHIHNNK